MPFSPKKTQLKAGIISFAAAVLSVLVVFLLLNNRVGWLDLGWSDDSSYAEPEQFLRKVRRVRVGMTEAKVDAIFSKYGLSSRQEPLERVTRQSGKRPSFVKYYSDSSAATEFNFLLEVSFDEQARVNGKNCTEVAK